MAQVVYIGSIPMLKIEQKADIIVTTLEPNWVCLVGLGLPRVVPVLGVNLV